MGTWHLLCGSPTLMLWQVRIAGYRTHRDGQIPASEDVLGSSVRRSVGWPWLLVCDGCVDVAKYVGIPRASWWEDGRSWLKERE